jgi:hypothetical protein
MACVYALCCGRYMWSLVSADRDPDTTQPGYTIQTGSLLPFTFGKDPTVLALPPLQVGGVYTIRVRVAFTRDLSVFNSAQVRTMRTRAWDRDRGQGQRAGTEGRSRGQEQGAGAMTYFVLRAWVNNGLLKPR